MNSRLILLGLRAERFCLLRAFPSLVDQLFTARIAPETVHQLAELGGQVEVDSVCELCIYELCFHAGKVSHGRIFLQILRFANKSTVPAPI